MADQHPRSGDAELRQLLRQRGDEIVVDVEAGLRAVEGGANRKRQVRRTRRTLGAVVVAAAAVVALVLGRALVAQPNTNLPDITDRPGVVLPDGTYRYRLTAHDLRAASHGQVSPQDITNNAGTWTWKMHDGHWSVHLNPVAPAADPSYPCSGTFTIDGGVATFVRTVNRDPVGDCVPPTWSARYAVYQSVVRWAAVSVPGFGWFFAPEPWVHH